jgi:phosphate transport system substrate-binding protein
MKSHFALLGIAFSAGLLSGCSGDASQERKLTLTGSSTVAPLIADIAKRFEADHPDVRVEVQTGGSSRGIADTQSGLADIGMTSRNLKDGELDLEAHRIAVDGVALIVHRDNPVSELSREQVIGLYTGRIDNWSEVGGADQNVVVTNKAEGRGTLEVFLTHFGLDSADIVADLIVGENQQAIKTVAGNPDAIGYVSVGAAEYEAESGTAIKLLRADGAMPGSESVADGSYPIFRPLLLLTKGAPSGTLKAFVDYARSDAVHDLVKQHLYVPAGK